jgi:ATP-dependent Lon protease
MGKGTAKSHIFSEFSPHGMLVSGGEVTVPKLFVNNSSGKIGLVGYWDVIALDEFAGKQKKVDKALVDILKNYMANKTFSRGVEPLGAEASMVFVGNTKHTVPYMLKNTDLFDELPDKYYDSAFIDRLHTYIPGWEVGVIRGEMFSNGYGFVVDYLAEILRHLRSEDYSERYKVHFELSSDISTRDRDGVHKTFSGLLKLLFPAGEASPAEMEELLKLALEGRKRVKDQLMRLDQTYPRVDFSYSRKGGQKVSVATLEEMEFPAFYYRGVYAESDAAADGPSANPEEPSAERASQASADQRSASAQGPTAGHLTFSENQKGVTFDDLFGPYLKGAREIVVTDPYIRAFHQVRNIMELAETIANAKPPADEVHLRLITCADGIRPEKQAEYLAAVADACEGVGIQFSWAFDETNTIHARHIVTDAGWKIALDRGLDIFQPFEMNNAFSFANRQQRFRSVKAFEVIYLRT